MVTRIVPAALLAAGAVAAQVGAASAAPIDDCRPWDLMCMTQTYNPDPGGPPNSIAAAKASELGHLPCRIPGLGTITKNCHPEDRLPMNDTVRRARCVTAAAVDGLTPNPRGVFALPSTLYKVSKYCAE